MLSCFPSQPSQIQARKWGLKIKAGLSCKQVGRGNVELRHQSQGCPLTWCSCNNLFLQSPKHTRGVLVNLQGHLGSCWPSPLTLGMLCWSPQSTTHCPSESPLAGACSLQWLQTEPEGPVLTKTTQSWASEWREMDATLHLWVTAPPPIFTWGCTTMQHPQAGLKIHPGQEWSVKAGEYKILTVLS